MINTKYNSPVSFLNEAGKDILSISSAHIYSTHEDKFKTDKTDPVIKNNEFCKKIMSVHYNTGEIHADWWFVTWVTSDGIIHITSPLNFQGFLKKLNDALSSVPAEVGLLAGLAIGAANLPAGAIAAATIVTAVILRTFFSNANTLDTDGFKRFDLTPKDSGNQILITLGEKSVKFKSKTGSASTNAKTVSYTPILKVNKLNNN
ncbi:hypothetical protein [Xenorhabdus anantnagensis]|uniref:Up-regulated in Daf-2 domain-containing protein n=1 Tax=Xenorhabdus anantnagensis TaxID=3025875 RepID=A0ABT5LVV4_9GAMM|nr:hypothetical protein [Xenorhabdus anantnagensis]MDC9598557.1 hypothetical protein [Xenorhabdus anantnagensis]